MIPNARANHRPHWFLGAGFGLYAAVIALAPTLAAKAILVAPLVLVPLLWVLLSSSTAWVSLFFLCALLTPPLPIALGDSGPHIALLLAAAGLFIGLLRLAEWRFHADALSISLLALWAILAASVGWAALYSGISIAAGSFARVLLFGISIYVFLYTRNGPGLHDSARGFRMIRLLFLAAAASALFACVDFYFQFPAPAGYEPQFIWLESGVYRRAQGVFYEASTLGNLCAFFLEMIAVALFRPKEAQPVSRTALLAGGAAFAAALVLSFSRGSLVNCAVALIVLLWLHRKTNPLATLIRGNCTFERRRRGHPFHRLPDFRRSRVAARFRCISIFFRVAQHGALRPPAKLADADRFPAGESVARAHRSGIQNSPVFRLHRNARHRRQHLSDVTGGNRNPRTHRCPRAECCDSDGCLSRRAIDPRSAQSFCGAWMLCFWAGQSVQMFSADLLTYWRILPVYFFVLALAARQEA